MARDVAYLIARQAMALCEEGIGPDHPGETSPERAALDASIIKEAVFTAWPDLDQFQRYWWHEAGVDPT